MQAVIVVSGTLIFTFAGFFWMFKVEEKRNRESFKKFRQHERDFRTKFELSLNEELTKLLDLLDVPKLRDEKLRGEVLDQLRIILVSKLVYREISNNERRT